MRTIHKIIKAAGGAKKIEAATDNKISADAVYKWPSIGIPDRHWPVLIRLAKATPDELYKANQKARQPERVAS